MQNLWSKVEPNPNDLLSMLQHRAMTMKSSVSKEGGDFKVDGMQILIILGSLRNGFQRLPNEPSEYATAAAIAEPRGDSH